MRIRIRPFHKADYNDVAYIYQAGMDTGIATFEMRVPDYEEWNDRFISSCRFIATIDGEIVGWCALSAVSKRKVYKGVAEVTVYVHPDYRGKGIGRYLLGELVSKSEKEGYWTLTAHIFPENKASIVIHDSCGFREVGYHEKIAQRNDKWHDNVLMERRTLL